MKMTVKEIISKLQLEEIFTADGNREVDGVYTGDLLSWVMGKLSYGNAWVTIMNNVNIIAVASLADASCIILTENSEIGRDVIDKASANGINLLRTSKSSYEICCLLGSILND
jgi:serine kinase of HPr protein (carbohydrate metabolism regulator)